jgi:hypothetical protein
MLLVAQQLLCNGLSDDYGVDEEVEEFNYYGTTNDEEDQYYDDEDEFGYGDVYTFDEGDSTNKKSNKQRDDDEMSPTIDIDGGLHFRSNKVRPVFMDKQIDDHLQLEDDHKEYYPKSKHPGAGVHNGHDSMDKTHTGLVHDQKGTGLQYGDDDEEVDDVPPYARGQYKDKPQKPTYDSDFDGNHVNHIPTGYRGSRTKVKGYDHVDNVDSYHPAKSKPRKPLFGGDFNSDVRDLHAFGSPARPKPPFLKAVPVHQDTLDEELKVNPTYYDSEEKVDGLHFASSYKEKRTGPAYHDESDHGDSYAKNARGRDL